MCIRKCKGRIGSHRSQNAWEHTLALIEKAHEGDKAARDTLAEENMGLVWSMGEAVCNRGVEMEDLCQIGSIGLLKAID